MNAAGREPIAAAYGLRYDGLGVSSGLALRGAEAWPPVRVQRVAAQPNEPVASSVGDREATIVSPVGVLRVDRAAATLSVRFAPGATDADLVHPGLWPAAAVLARWRGAETLHAGAFVAPDGGAWAVMAESGGGKSSFLAALTLAGIEVLVDDLVILEGGQCYAGPRCIDLRPEAVAELDLGDRPTVLVRASRRRRLDLEPCDGRRPLRGFVELAWGGDQAEVTALAPSAALAALARHRRVVGLGADFEALLELAGCAVVRLTRPRTWTTVRASVAKLIDAIDG